MKNPRNRLRKLVAALCAIGLMTNALVIVKYLSLKDAYDQLYFANKKLSGELDSRKWVNYRSNAGWLARTEGFAASVGSGDVDVVFLGDSLIENWQTDPAFPAINSMNQGVSGDVIEGVLNRLDLVRAFSPRIVVLEIGTNDLKGIGDVDSAARGVCSIIEYLREGGCEQVILLGLFPTPENSAEIGGKWMLLNAVYQRIAENIDGVRYVDVSQAFANSDGFQEASFFCDDIHLTAVGYNLLNRTLEPVLEESLGRKDRL